MNHLRSQRTKKSREGDALKPAFFSRRLYRITCVGEHGLATRSRKELT